jgi:hypothetical protein
MLFMNKAKSPPTGTAQENHGGEGGVNQLVEMTVNNMEQSLKIFFPITIMNISYARDTKHCTYILASFKGKNETTTF